ncbi:pilus assembly PilX family protein [Pseudacidovorax sp. NFM-22]|uniref:pilus assembly PilX family protein n=1 Tax=Pseudacidovorax sp. NFM-22 TaxID=2744469 RepID=UPI001F444245|nr:hypothetical protein [Pseudacidovorax sp. NFM-22]
MSLRPVSRPRRAAGLRRQRGVVLVFCLIVLVVLLAGGVAVTRSMNASLSNTGSLALRRDLVNQAESAIKRAMDQTYPVGGTAAANKALNYSPTPLAVNDMGIPNALLTDTAFAAVGSTANDTDGAIGDLTGGVRIRYVVDRMCDIAAQSATDQGRGHCVPITREAVGGSAQLATRAPPPVQPIYRVTVRVTGPRNTQVFVQSSFTKPES